MPAVTSFGLIDKNGNKLAGTNDFIAAKLGTGSFLLTFNRDVRRATVTASPRNLDYCDDAGLGVTVCNQTGRPDQLGFILGTPNSNLGFSFMLIDPMAGDENEG